MGKKIVLIGGGGHCKSVLDTLLRNNEYDEIVITDNDIPVDSTIMGCRVAGNDDVLSDLLVSGFTDAFITVGSIKSTKVRHILFEKAETIGFNMINIIDKSATVSEYAKLGKGIFIGKCTIVNADAAIGDAAIINTNSVIEHECVVGNFTHISVGAKLCGNVKIGNDTFIGAGSVVIQGVRIGNNVIIGAGSTVIDNVNDNATKVGLVK
ncbi:acetyltransferase [Ruminococcus sp.]|uniref:acetyltransferase n=1 Tax=Ruminococcus sp. TaxID=41978 RepID=UPI0025F204D6|nr:acetyltransferase [Ruminococcus sp.]MCR4639503.1 acetyltransferase [Ruminococcus sp.]